MKYTSLYKFKSDLPCRTFKFILIAVDEDPFTMTEICRAMNFSFYYSENTVLSGIGQSYSMAQLLY